MPVTSPDPDAVRRQLEAVVASPAFRRAERSTALLRFIVERTLDGQAERLKEYTLGAEALGRGDAFDPRADPVVRAEASRLRARLEQYYDGPGRADPILIALTKGSYVPQFVPNVSPTQVGGAAGASASVGRRRFPPTLLVPWGLATVLAAIVAVAWLRAPAASPPQPPARFEVELTADGSLASDVGTTVVLSPDGTRMIFVSRGADGRTHLNMRALDRADTIRLAGTEGARGPFVSPDGRWIGFWADGNLKKVAADGGAPVVLCDAGDLLGASWGGDDTIVAALGAPGQLVRVPATGGTPVVAFDLSPEGVTARWPQLLPGGDAVIYTALSGAGADRANIEVQSASGGNRTVLVRGATFGRYLRSGYLTYVNQGTLYGVPMDVRTRSIRGAPIPLLNDVAYSPLFGHAQVDVADTGLLVYRKGAESGRSVVATIDRAGGVTPLVPAPGRYGWIRPSPDGTRLALTTYQSGLASIDVLDVKTGDSVRVTSHSGEYTGLTWLPGGYLAFGGSAGLRAIRANASAAPAPLLDGPAGAQTPWSIDAGARRLAFYARGADTGFDLWTAPIVAGGAGPRLGSPEPFLRSRAFEVYPSLSPDGAWIAYASNESGAWEIYVRRFPDDGTKQRVSVGGGVVPQWSPNGRELIYRTETHHLMVVRCTPMGPSLVADKPRRWSPQALAETGVLPNFSVDATGERIVALLPAPDEHPQTANHVTVIVGFDEQIRRATAR
jgi:serine/threonine-protein kinase